MLLLLYRLHTFASDQIKEEKKEATFQQFLLQKATFWEFSGNFLGNLEQLVESPNSGHLSTTATASN